MIIEGEKFSGTFISRPNRFLTFVRINGEPVPCYLPDPGRLKELLLPGVEVVVRSPADIPASGYTAKSDLDQRNESEMRNRKGKQRKTKYDMLAAVINGNGKEKRLVSVDTRLPNKLVREALLNHGLREFNSYNKVTAEFPYGSSRLDFMLEERNGKRTGKCLLEVKSCSLVVDGVALFPDAPTERGSRHLRELMKMKSLSNHYRASVMFIVQRDDAKSFEPNRSTDPKFAETLRAALRKGVEAYAYTIDFNTESMTLSKSIPVIVSGG